MSEATIPPLSAYFVPDAPTEIVDRLLQQAGGGWQWAYVEKETGAELLWLADLLTMGWQVWRYGRAFHPGSELTWQQQADGRYALRLLTETAPPAVPGLDWGTADTGWQPWGQPAITRLHGELDSNHSQESGLLTWSEARIPRWLVYPVPTTPANAPAQVTLRTQPYTQNGVIGLTRLLSVA